MTWGCNGELCYCRPVTKPSRGAGQASINSPQSMQDGIRACRAGEGIAAARGAIVTWTTKVSYGRIPLCKNDNNSVSIFGGIIS